MSERSLVCPFCKGPLAKRSDTGRYRCAACASTSHEADIGWLETPALLPGQIPAPSHGMSRIGECSPFFAMDGKGNPVTRERSCECGRRFTQTLLSERFLEIVEGKSAKAISQTTSQIPGYYVPVHCPACERRDLGMQARLDESRLHQPRITERDDAA